MTVFVVLHDNYGDQGLDFHGAFATRKLAENYINNREPDQYERELYMIEEAIVHD